jgi:DNA-binding PadR family transcriptional regulator
MSANPYSITPTRPDLDYIKTKILIMDVASELGLPVKGYRARCWRLENHRNGDRDPSITFLKKKNRGKCWICDQRTWSTLDLVMLVFDCDLKSAVEWIVERFPVPMARPGKHLGQRQDWNQNYRVGSSYSRLDWLIRSGLWRELTPAQRSVLAVLDVFTDSETNEATISYRGLMRYGGVGSSSTIRRALHRFQQLGLLEISRGVSEGFRSVSSYKLTFDSPKFRGVVTEIYRRHREAIELERLYWSEERKRKKREERSSATCIRQSFLH